MHELPPDLVTVNLVRLVGLDKHKARECEDVVMEILRRAVMSERERCAVLAESDRFYGSALQHDIAAAIRAQK